MKQFLTCLLFPLCTCSQLKPLSIGDKLPPGILTTVTVSPTTIHEKSKPGKLVILDFFATWCTACVKRFPRLDSLQNLFRGSMQVILVCSKGAADTEAKLTAFFNKRKKPNGEPWQFPLIINDSVLEQLFPHRFIPHYVWICNNRVVAITSSNELTAKNIKAVLKRKKLNLPLKKE